MQAYELTKRKVRTMLRIARSNGHDSIVLSAFGCGAFRNPPREIAGIFQEVIASEYAAWLGRSDCVDEEEEEEEVADMEGHDDDDDGSAVGGAGAGGGAGAAGSAGSAAGDSAAATAAAKGGEASYIKEFVFAIINDHNTGRKHNSEGNIKPFLETFKVKLEAIADLAK